MTAPLSPPCGRAAWHALSEHLRAALPEASYLAWFSGAVPLAGSEGALTLAVPNDFTHGWIREHFSVLLEQWAGSAGLVRGVQVVVDSAATGAAPGSLPTDAQAAPLHGRDHAVRRARQRELPPYVLARLLAERGFWSLTPGQHVTAYRLEDLHGVLEVEPGGRPPPGTYEACVLGGLLSLWAGGCRSQPRVESSLRRLAATMQLAWSGRTAEQLRGAIETLKTTTYRMSAVDERGGSERLFSLLDEVQTDWLGPPSTPHRRVVAVFSRTVWEAITEPRVLRPVDLGVVRALGPQRELATRLFLFLEAHPGHRMDADSEEIERIVDHRLAGTLGAHAPPWKLCQQLERAGRAVVACGPRYSAIEIVPRRKRGLLPGEPRQALRVVRRRRAGAGPA